MDVTRGVIVPLIVEDIAYPSERIDAIRADPADNLVLEAAGAGKG